MSVDIFDEDGIDTNEISFLWSSNGEVIEQKSGLGANTFQFDQSEVGALISLQAVYQDSFGNNEIINAVFRDNVKNSDDRPSENPVISGSNTLGSNLSVDISNIFDLDGFDPQRTEFSWIRRYDDGP